MAREWEVPQNANALDFINNPWLRKYNPKPRMLAERKFFPEELTQDDMRDGVSRRYADPRNLIYLRRELFLRNIDGLEGWGPSTLY